MTDIDLTQDARVGVVGSNSSTGSLTADLVGDSRNRSLNGRLVLVSPKNYDGTTEYGVGTVTEITTTNTYHEDPALRGVIAQQGFIGNLTGRGDIKTAKIDMQSAFRHDGENLSAIGGSLSFAPSTGEPIFLANADSVRSLCERTTKDLFYIGSVYQQKDIPLPLSFHDFSDARGAEMSGFFGPSGSGKALDVNTPIPTPNGFVLMKDLAPGSKVFDQDGKTCTVLAVYDQPPHRECFEVQFSDGSTIIADAEHLWEVYSTALRASMNASRGRERKYLLTKAQRDAVAAVSRHGIAGKGEVTLSEIAEAFAVPASQTSKSTALSKRFHAFPGGRVLVAEQNGSVAPFSSARRSLMIEKEALLNWAKRGEIKSQEKRLALVGALEGHQAPYVTAREVSKAVGASRTTGNIYAWIEKSGADTHYAEATAHLDETVRQRHHWEKTVDPKAFAEDFLRHVEKGLRNQEHLSLKPEVLTTREIVDRISEGESFSIPVAKPVSTPERDLPLPPYTLGAWLGDGSSRGGLIFSADAEVIENVRLDGYSVFDTTDKYPFRYRVEGLRGQLGTLGVRSDESGVSNKRIPEQYLFASIDQRHALLQGLMDTDGTVNRTSGTVSYTTILPSLAEDVRVLAASLGYRVTVTSRVPTLDGGPQKRAYNVNFHPRGEKVFRLSRKVSALEEATKPVASDGARTNHRYIRAITPVESRPVRCITVDSERSLYLAGKDFIPTHNTYNATMFTAAQMRHLRQAFLLIEPQSQFTTNSKVKRELPLDLRALADAQGREVKQISVAQQIRLPEDPSLLCDLLAGASFFGANRLIGANNQASNAHDVVEAFLEATPKWSSMTSEDILNRILQHLIERVENDAVVVSKAPKERLQRNLQAALDQDEDGGRERYKALMRVFGPLHNIFSETTAQGTPRLKMNEIVKALCNPDIGSAGNRRARPFYILTLADQSADNEGRETEVSKAMRNSKTQMVILRTLFSALEAEARWLYQSEDLGTANLMVIMDEAARFTSDSHKDVEQRAMAADMARYFRELRKYAVGFTLILQEPSALHDSIWKQLQNGFRAFAGGMVGNDLDKVREQVGAGGAMSLYQQLARPSKDNPIYPWMLCGSISPLSVTSAPIFMEAFTKSEQWEQANKTWLPGMFNISDIWQG